MASDPVNDRAALRRWSPAVASATMPWRADEPCGDAAGWFPAAAVGADPAAPTGAAQQEDDGLMVIVDGLGHGAEAALASGAAMRVIAETPAGPWSFPELTKRLDAALSGLRGAAVGLLSIEGRQLRHAGVGNTRALRLRGAQLARLPSQNGIVGGGLPARITVTTLDLLPGDWLLMFTDGLGENLRLPVELPEWRRDPTLFCRHLLDLGASGRDDAGVLVKRMVGGTR